MAKLRKLKLAGGDLVDKGANQHADIVFFKADIGEGADAEALEKRLADVTAALATAKAIEAEGLMARGDFVGARAIFKVEPRSYDAYQARLRGGQYEIPVAKRAPDHRADIKMLVGAGDMKGLEQLFNAKPESGNQYRELMMAGEL